MVDNLERTFQHYTDAARSRLQKRGEEEKTKEALRLFVNKAIELRTLVDQLENQSEFRELVVETRSLFSGDYHRKSEGAWQQAVKNFFRRSGYYLDLFEGKSLGADTAFHNYCQAFQALETQITYLAPMEFVHFAEPILDFGAFRICRFRVDELEAITQNTVNEVFYPWALIDVKSLQNYWFVYLTETSPMPPLGRIHVDWNQIGRVDIEYTVYPKAIESAFQQLALFDWQADWWREPSIAREEERERGWRGFSIPFVLRVDNNLLTSPRRVPDLTGLETEPFIDTQTGEEIGEIPVTYIRFNKSEADAFRVFVQRTGKLLASLRAKQNEWEFLEVSLGFFIKAFFTEGLEQMLWHITTMEALLGDKEPGFTKRLAQRIALILGKDENERKAIRKKFDELYDFRSSLVHGN